MVALLSVCIQKEQHLVIWILWLEGLLTIKDFSTVWEQCFATTECLEQIDDLTNVTCQEGPE
jgi:hypothetical protein